MSIEEDLVAVLTASTAVTAVVSTRIRPLIASEDETFPYIVYDRISTEDPVHLLGGTKRKNTRVSFDCFAKSYDVCELAASVLYDQLHGKRGSVNGTAYDSIFVDDMQTFPIPPADASDTATYVASVTINAWHAATVPSSL